MEVKRVGIGSQYLVAYRDASGACLAGGQNCRLRLPTGIPAKDFWSVTICDAETRSLLQNGQPKPSISTYDQPEVDADGSVDAAPSSICAAPVWPSIEGRRDGWSWTPHYREMSAG